MGEFAEELLRQYPTIQIEVITTKWSMHLALSHRLNPSSRGGRAGEWKMGKPVILTFVHYYLPGYKSGGPVRTIANMVEHLSDQLDFWIVTSDRDALDSDPYPNVTIDAWNAVGKDRKSVD